MLYSLSSDKLETVLIILVQKMLVQLCMSGLYHIVLLHNTTQLSRIGQSSLLTVMVVAPGVMTKMYIQISMVKILGVG